MLENVVMLLPQIGLLNVSHLDFHLFNKKNDGREMEKEKSKIEEASR